MDFGILVPKKEHEPKEGLTISRRLYKNDIDSLSLFSFGKGTDISPEAYSSEAIYIGAGEDGSFELGGDSLPFKSGDIIYVPKNRLLGASAGEEGFLYFELLMEKETFMNDILKAGEVFALKDLIGYENGGIANMDLAKNEGMKFMILSFDEGCELSEHRAPGNALLFALEGKAVIGYEGKDYEISEGENFRFEKNGLHSVKAKGRFKMALLLMLK